MTAPTEAPRLPDFLVIGAERCGTTTLAQYLASHEHVFIPPQKELHFFDRPGRSVEDYAQAFAAAPAGAVVGEATPGYLASRSAHEGIVRTVPQARLIAILRDPVARAYSHYWLRQGWRVEPRSFQQAVNDEMAGNPGGFAYLARGRYHEQLARLRSVHPSAELQVHLLDDLRNDPMAVLSRIFAFIGVPELATAEPAFRNQPHRVRSLWLWRKTGTWRRGPIQDDRLSGSASRAAARIAAAVDRMNAVPIDYPPLSVDLRATLVDHFRADIRSLEGFLERRLDAWLSGP